MLTYLAQIAVGCIVSILIHLRLKRHTTVAIVGCSLAGGVAVASLSGTDLLLGAGLGLAGWLIFWLFLSLSKGRKGQKSQ